MSTITLAASAAAGAVIHLGLFIRGEWHLLVQRIVISHFVVICVIWWFFVPNFHACSLIAASYLVSLFSSMIIYRLFFHRLRRFPGPKLAAVTKLWHVFEARYSTNYLVMQRLHRKYGTCVRTGPNEISLFHPAGIEILDGARNKNKKDEWYDLLQPRTSTIFTRDEEDHKERRHVWSQAISSKSLNTYTPRLVRLVVTLAQCIESYGEKPVKVNDVMSWFAFDAMGDFAFGEDFGMMKSSKWHPAVERQHNALSFIGPINDTPWLAHMAMNFVPFLGKVKDWNQMVAFCDESMEKRFQRSEVHDPDMASWFIEEYLRIGPFRSLQNRKLLLSGNAISVIVAGSDTTRATLISVWYFLAKHPEHAEKIFVEMEKVEETDPNALALLPHLNGAINETLRLVPPQLTGGGRITGPEGLWVDNETWIPGGVKVTVPKYVVSRLHSAFKYPDEFIPERWYSRPELIHDKRAYGPFTVGNRQCVGKNLALLELRLVIAMLLKRYKVRFSSDSDPDSLMHGLKDQVTAQPGECWCVFEPRQAL